MKCVSWNVNGLRAVMQKDFEGIFASLDADLFCLQETKLQEGQVSLELPGYFQYWNYAEKKGYSGTAIFSKKPALHCTCGIGEDEFDHEGRVITLEFDTFFFITCYTPNSQDGLKRLDWRMRWEEAFLRYLKRLEETKPVIFCGDLNVAHEEIDIKNPSSNHMNAGFSDQEREKMTQLLQSGFIDTFRFFYPDLKDAYSWWSYRFKARERNAGWRIDYFIVSECLKDFLQGASIHQEIMGSDHCPIELLIGLE